MNKNYLNDLDKIKRYILTEYCLYTRVNRKNIREVYIQADNFSDSARGQVYLGDGNTLVLSMSEGYSDLYIEYPNGYRDELIKEMPSRRECNEVAQYFGYKFI